MFHFLDDCKGVLEVLMNNNSHRTSWRLSSVSIANLKYILLVSQISILFNLVNVVNLKYLLLAPSNSDPLSRNWLLSRVLLQIAGVLAVLICKLVYVLIVNNMILKYDLT